MTQTYNFALTFDSYLYTKENIKYLVNIIMIYEIMFNWGKK